MALILMLTGPAAFAQLSGAYTINSAQPTGGTNYASFTAAAAALTAGGVSGPVTFTVTGGPYNEQVSLGQFTGASAANRVTFNGGGRTIQFGSSNSAERAVITLNGADFVTINNLVVDATVGGTSMATYGWGIHLLNSSNNVTISNCTVVSDTTATTSNFAGIVSSASTTGPTTSGTTASQNLTLEGNTVLGGYYGISVVGSGATASPTPGVIIRNNNVREFYFYGIYTSYLGSARIIGNDISRPARATVSSFYGIYLTTGVSGAAVEKNRIHQAFSPASTSTSGAYGIYLTTGTAATTTNNPNVVANNLVYDLNGNGVVYGLYNGSSGSSRFYHNTVNLDDQTNTSTSDAYGFYHTTGLNVEFRNNIVQVTRAGLGDNYALFFSSATGGTIASNYNSLVVNNSPTAFTGHYSGTDYATLANWRTANNGAYDQNSVAVPAQFVNTATGNLQPRSSALNGAATPLARVPDDITGAPRSTTAPDIGAYEFIPAAGDVALVSINSPTSPATAGASTVTVTIRNNGAAVLNTLRLEYVLNGGTPVVQNVTLPTGLAAGATTTVTFTAPATLQTLANTLTVTASLPNGTADDATNNVQTITVYTPLAGTYTINRQQPTGGTNFASFSAAADALSSAGITAPVRFNVLNGPYAEQCVIRTIRGVSATDTVVIDGGANRQTLRFAGTAMLLIGTDYLTLNSLTIDASAGAAGVGIHLVGQANNNRISNSVIMGSAAGTSSVNNAGIAASGTLASTTTAGDANNLRIENNLISGGYYGVVLTGTSTTARVSGTRVTNNEIRDFYLYGLDVENTDGARLLGNNIHRTNRTVVSTFYGIYLIGNVSTAVERNRIHDTFTGSPASTSITYGIYLSADGTAGTENDFVNNLLYNFNGAGTEYGLYNTGAAFARYYHNTVSLDNQASSANTLSYGFYQTGSATGIDFKNNVVSVTRSGSGSRYALFFLTPASVITSDYNDLFVGTGANYYTGHTGPATTGVNYATLANWRTANGGAYDQNSIQADPRFAAPASGDFQPSNTQLNSAGTPATLARVPRDIANVTRTSPPDMGAYEFTPIPNDVALVSIDAPTSPAVPGTNPVTVTIRNGGSAVLTSVTLSYALNNGQAVTQAFTGLTLASGATQQLSFTTGVVPVSGSNTLTVTASLPNGVADPNPGNNAQTITFIQPTPVNDEPCAAISLGSGTLTTSNSGASASQHPGIVTPACSPAAQPRDVWFLITPSGTSTTLTLTGDAAGMVRVFSATNCATGPFTQVFCQGSGTNNTTVGTVSVTGLTAGQRYYVAVSGYGSADTPGPFTISATALLSTRSSNSAALMVYPNPSASGQLTLRLASPAAAGTVELLNALGQTVIRQPLTSAAEQQVLTQRLAPGLYTLRVKTGTETLSRKVVLQ